MDWEIAHTSFLDELAKIGEVNLAGLSPKSALSMQPAPPFETTGLSKAMAILDRLEGGIPKVAGRRVPNYALPGGNTLGRGSTKEPTHPYDTAKSGVLHGLAGITGGGAVGDFVAGAGKSFAQARKFRMRGAQAGLAVAGGEFARKQLKARKERMLSKSAALASPGLQLKASRQVGSVGGKTMGRFSASPRAVSRLARVF